MSIRYNKFGGVAQSGRAVGSYPACHWFKSSPRYHEPFALNLNESEWFRAQVHGAARHVPEERNDEWYMGYIDFLRMVNALHPRHEVPSGTGHYSLTSLKSTYP